MSVRKILIAALVAGLPGVAWSAELAGDITRGEKVFIHHLCHTCHGTVGQGGERGAGPKIAPGVWPYAAFAQQVRKPRLVMIPYSEKTLPEQELADMHAYLSAIKAAPAAKDVPLLKEF